MLTEKTQNVKEKILHAKRKNDILRIEKGRKIRRVL